jgi:hypothetical protein
MGKMNSEVFFLPTIVDRDRKEVESETGINKIRLLRTKFWVSVLNSFKSGIIFYKISSWSSNPPITSSLEDAIERSLNKLEKLKKNKKSYALGWFKWRIKIISATFL